MLAVRHEDKWAAMGMSRRDVLMDKPFEFNSLTDLIKEYETSYVSIVPLCEMLFLLHF